MRLQSIQPDGSFKEYGQVGFHVKYQEVVLEKWLEDNPDAILEDSKLLIIGRQVRTNLGGYIDLLGVDQYGNLAVVELKRDRTPRDTLAQALEYASFAAGLSPDQLEEILIDYRGEETGSLAEFHRRCFELPEDQGVAFNKRQRLVVVGQRITPEIRQTARYLRDIGLQVTCLEFSLFEGKGGQQILTSDIVVGHEPLRSSRVASGSQRKITREEYLSSLDDNGRAFFEPLVAHAEKRGWPIHWGTNGFSMNCDVGGTHVAMCFGYRPQSVFKQSLYTDLFRRGGMSTKTAAPERLPAQMAENLRATGLVESAGREVKIVVDRRFSASEMKAVLDWLEELAAKIEEHGLAE